MGLTHTQIAHGYAVSKSTVANIAQSYIKNGITNIIRYIISPNSAVARRKVNGCMKAHIIQIACGQVPDGYTHWTLRLLEEKLRMGLDTLIGRENFRQTLNK